ncbi:MAG: hypothetical protein KAU21_19775, partial [Gammaproteobacteria bacterium]|nr:hypothetical protein [Gammaproteobacteria bacterium]
EKLKGTDLQKNRSIIFMAALSLKLESLTEKQMLKQSQKKKYKARVEGILNNSELLKVNILSLAYEAESLVSQLTEDATQGQSVGRQQFIQLYVQKMRQYRVLNDITFEHYYATFNPSIDFAESFVVKLEASDKKQLTDYISKTLPQTTDKKARQAMVSDASYMLFKFGMQEQAKEMLTREMTTSRNPYYLMSTLGFSEKEEGNTAQALEWYEKAYKAAKGPATKLQWYGSFVRNLIKLKPEDKKAIKSHVNSLLSDYTNMADSFFGRNYRVLESLKKSTMKWADENKENLWIENIKAKELKKCSLSSKEIYKSSCEKFYKEFI